ncbi:DoxX family protein [Roseomonas terrae]|uniref:DoxX family protein n=1 Tax=Neoroseomonas terrae TaxID=424799 RepID=A0ABS5EQ54_9PROT|nr:DoxX family protein [Neoroseomonas terrae]MBR0653138.1 DoxX family protein [Neoroseomonas terrae]
MTPSRSPRSLLRFALNGLLAVFFLVGGTLNLFPPDAIRQDYARWGYPAWFHLVTGTLELLASGLIAMPRTRELGRAIAAVVMLGALTTLLVFADYGHAMAPAIVLAALLASQYLDGKARAAHWEGRAF